MSDIKLEKDFTVNEDGSITRLGKLLPETNEQIEQKKLLKERTDLEYEIFSHPERFSVAELSQKKSRFEELGKILGIDNKKSANALMTAKARLREKIIQDSESDIAQMLAKQKEHN